MNLNLFDNMDGLILREREETLGSAEMNNDTVSSGNGNTSRFPKNTPLAMAYVPFQQWGEVYDPEKALCSGTLFPDLDFPFERGGGQK